MIHQSFLLYGSLQMLPQNLLTSKPPKFIEYQCDDIYCIITIYPVYTIQSSSPFDKIYSKIYKLYKQFLSHQEHTNNG